MLYEPAQGYEGRGQRPQFVLANPVSCPDSGVIIKAQNRAAQRRLSLQIEYDGVLLQQVLPPLAQKNGEYRWQFRPLDFNLKPESLREGKHSLRVCHPGRSLSEPLTIVWHTQPPLVTAEISKPLGSRKMTITGRVGTKVPIAENPISVHLLFDLPETALRISLPARRHTIDSAGFAVFHFRVMVQGLPNVLAGQIDLAQPFFTLVVADAAGNHFSQSENYAWFATPGRKRMGAQLALRKNQRNAVTAQRRAIHADFQSTPVPSLSNLSNQVALDLQAQKLSPQAYQLKWKRPDREAGGEPVIAVVWRDEEPIAICFTDEYRDEEPWPDQKRHYRVTQIEGNGRIASSNWESPEPAKTLSADDAPPLLAQAFTPGEAAAATHRTRGRDETAIATVVGKHKPAIQDCYQRGLRWHYDLKGKVVVRFVVTPQGGISEAKVVSSTLQNASVENCMLDRIKRWNDFGKVAPEEGETAFKQTYIFGY